MNSISNGTVDTSFSGDGYLEPDTNLKAGWQANDVVEPPNGNIIVNGSQSGQAAFYQITSAGTIVSGPNSQSWGTNPSPTRMFIDGTSLVVFGVFTTQRFYRLDLTNSFNEIVSHAVLFERVTDVADGAPYGWYYFDAYSGYVGFTFYAGGPDGGYNDNVAANVPLCCGVLGYATGQIFVEPDPSLRLYLPIAGPTEVNNPSIDIPHIGRLDYGGTLDNTFGSGGFMTSHTTGVQDDFRLVIPDGSGGVYIALTSYAGSGDIQVRHLLSNGTPDLVYGVGGSATYDSGGIAELVRAYHDAQNRILLTGRQTTLVLPQKKAQEIWAKYEDDES